MIYRKLDTNGDYTFGGNKNDYTKDNDAVRQAVQTRLKLLKYEWWENLDDGLPLWQQIMASRNKKAAEKAIRDRIDGTEHVKAILLFEPSWDNDNRSLTIHVTLSTEYGTLDLSEVM